MTDINEHLAYENAELLRKWGCTTPQQARAYFEQVKAHAKAKYGYTDQEIAACLDHRQVLAMEADMKREEALDQLRRYERGEWQPPQPQPSVLDRAATFKNDSDRADIIAGALPAWGETTDHTNHDRVIEMLERRQGITR